VFASLGPPSYHQHSNYWHHLLPRAGPIDLFGLLALQKRTLNSLHSPITRRSAFLQFSGFAYIDAEPSQVTGRVHCQRTQATRLHIDAVKDDLD